jgi:hypothetical protein
LEGPRENFLTNAKSRILLKMIIVAQLAKKLPRFYGTGRFITVFSRARRWILSQMNPSVAYIVPKNPPNSEALCIT